MIYYILVYDASNDPITFSNNELNQIEKIAYVSETNDNFI